MNEHLKILCPIPSFVNQNEILEMRVPETDEDCNHPHIEMKILEMLADDLLLYLESIKSSLMELGYSEEYANRMVIDAVEKTVIETGCNNMGNVTKMVDDMVEKLQLLPDDDSKMTATDIVNSERLRQMRLYAKHLKDISVKKLNETGDL